jgi:hypothetical protein
MTYSILRVPYTRPALNLRYIYRTVLARPACSMFRTQHMFAIFSGNPVVTLSIKISTGTGDDALATVEDLSS